MANVRYARWLLAVVVIGAPGASGHASPDGAVRCWPDNRANPSRLDCRFAGGSLALQSHGLGDFSKPSGPRVGFTVRLAAGDWIERGWVVEFEHDPVLLLEVNDGEAGAGLAVRVDAGTGRVLWQAHIPGFNVGEPLLVGGDAFVTAISFVGRLSLQTGGWRWQRKLEPALRFHSLRQPRLEERVLVVGEDNVFRRGRKLAERQLRLDAGTGVLLAVPEPDLR